MSPGVTTTFYNGGRHSFIKEHYADMHEYFPFVLINFAMAIIISLIVRKFIS